MSRWHDQFTNNPFQEHWKNLLILSSQATVKDKTVVRDVEELARAKKAIKFIEELINSCYPELIPESLWNIFNNETVHCLNQINAYQSSSNIEHLRNANGHIDTLLNHIRPYMVSGKSSAQAAAKAYKAYSDSVKENMESLRENTKNTIDEIKTCKDAALELQKEILDSKNTIEEFENKLFQGDDEEDGLEETIKTLVTQAKNNNNAIINYHQQLTKGNEKGPLADETQHPEQLRISKYLVWRFVS